MECQLLGSELGTKVNKESPSHVLGLTLMPPKGPSNVPSTRHIPFPSQREPHNSGKRVYHMPPMSQHRAEESEEAVPQTVSMFVGTQARRKQPVQWQGENRVHLPLC